MDGATVAGALAAFLYVAALWYAAPLFIQNRPAMPDRLRVAMVVGVAVPGLLGLFHLLYAPLLWIGLGALCLYRGLQRHHHFEPDVALCITLAGTLVICWPSLVRPLVDGDTLLYHLPNAVAFVQDHSIWTARAPYWLYPPASEIFTSGLFAASGRWSLPIAGILPALLLTARIYSIARDAGAPAYAAGSVGLAFICMPVAALEIGTLQNDLWLAAFFVEIVSGADRSPAALSVCALLKPYGFLLAFVGALAARLPWRIVSIGFIPLALWLCRDLILLKTGAALGFTTPAYFSGTIAGNLAVALPELLRGIASVSPQTFVWLGLLFIGLLVRPKKYALAGIAVLVLYLFLPFAFSNGTTNFVADASSLRFTLPALACGALVAATLVPRVPIPGAVLGYTLAVWGASDVLAIFWNDADTHRAILATVLALAAAAVVAKTRGLSVVAAALAVLVIARSDASSRAAGFYADWMRDPQAKRTGVFSWIAEHKPRFIVAENVRTGAVLMVSPETRAFDVSVEDGCAQARRRNALLLVGSNEGLLPAQVAAAVADAQACGVVIYRDGAGVIVRVHN